VASKWWGEFTCSPRASDLLHHTRTNTNTRKGHMNTRIPDPFGTPVPDDEPETRKQDQLTQWADKPGKDNARDAASYLGMFKKQKNAQRIIDELLQKPIVYFKAKDILRASRLPPLPPDDPHVAAALQLINAGQTLDPVYLLRGKLKGDVQVTVLDGYHRISAAYNIDQSTDVACQIARP
jgi:hypothetical protein